jgi:hypothetical protein
MVHKLRGDFASISDQEISHCCCYIALKGVAVLAKLCQELAKLALHNISSSASKSAERAARFSLSF